MWTNKNKAKKPIFYLNDSPQTDGSHPDPKYTFSPFTDSTTPTVPEEIICYIHGLLPVKNARNSEKKYVDCTLRCKGGYCCALCFSQQKKT